MLRTNSWIFPPGVTSEVSSKSRTWMNPITSSDDPRTTGYRECALSIASPMALPTVKDASIKSTSVRGTITS